MASQAKLNQIGNIQNCLQKLCDIHWNRELIWRTFCLLINISKTERGKSLNSPFLLLLAPVFLMLGGSLLSASSSSSWGSWEEGNVGCVYTCACVWIRNVLSSPSHAHSLLCGARYTQSDKNNKPCAQTVNRNSFNRTVVEEKQILPPSSHSIEIRPTASTTSLRGAAVKCCTT